MSKFKLIFDNLTKAQKVVSIILLFLFIIFVSITIPTLARYKNRNTNLPSAYWDGTIAKSYRKGDGTIHEPYIISSGTELAYFSKQLEEKSYDDIYFKLSNDILLNEGVLSYDEDNGITYILNDQTYYVDYYSNKYYDNIQRSGVETGSLNIFPSLNGFKGTFIGNSFTIYGLYITDEAKDEIALFTSLEGNVRDLYVKNSVIYGGLITGGISSNSKDSSIENIVYEGYVIGRNDNIAKSLSVAQNFENIVLNKLEDELVINLINKNSFISDEIISTSITGNYEIVGDYEGDLTVKINGETINDGSFEVDLGNNILNNVTISYSIDGSEPIVATLKFSNLSYNVNYNSAISAGVVAVAKNVSIKNVVNKAHVYGYRVSGGILAISDDSVSMINSYNTGKVESSIISGGLIAIAENISEDSLIFKSYNIGNIVSVTTGGLIGSINNNSSSFLIEKCFDASDGSYTIGDIVNSNVSVSTSYSTATVKPVKSGLITGTFLNTTATTLKNKEYLIENLDFSEFVDYDNLDENNNAVWVYEEDSHPIIYIDDIKNSIASIHVSKYAWNNLSYELSKIRISSNITFSIEDNDNHLDIKEKYYYISNSITPLLKDELSLIDTWIAYEDIERINNPGYYVIYAKIVDYNDNITYLNSDVLLLDIPGVLATLSLNDNTWNDYSNDLNNIYIDEEKEMVINVEESLSEVYDIKYYISDKVLTLSALDNISDDLWSVYKEGSLYNKAGNNIIYVKVTDNYDYSIYINSDYIEFIGGYISDDIIVGRNKNSYDYEKAYITDKSIVTFNYSYYNSSSTELNNHIHNLVSNILLPLGSRIVLMDNVTKKTYEYKIETTEDLYNYEDSCIGQGSECIKTATYPFTFFKEVGTGTSTKPFLETTYYIEGVTEENFDIILDFSKTNITVNYQNVKLFLELRDNEGNVIRSTLPSTIEDINIYSKVNSNGTEASLYLTTSYEDDNIIFNSDSSTNIEFSTGLSYKKTNNKQIIDTTYEDKIIGLSIKMIDSEGNIVDKGHLRSFSFRFENKTYYPSNDNVIRIDVNNAIVDTNKSINIITSLNNDDLEEGEYYFVISNYVSYDGIYYDELNDIELNIPVLVSYDEQRYIKHSFDVIINNETQIINKNNDKFKLSFDILQNGSLLNPNIRVSLYKKVQLTAYNQDYSNVDLNDLVDETLDLYANNVYYVSRNPLKYSETNKLYNKFEINLKTVSLENNSYKFVFELYDGTKRIDTMEKYFIVK